MAYGINRFSHDVAHMYLFAELKTSASAATFDYKTSTGSSQYKFGILANIVKFMKVCTVNILSMLLFMLKWDINNMSSDITKPTE